MRIIGGSLRGKKLLAPRPDSPLRPTSDRLRQVCFDMLVHRFSAQGEWASATVLDAFAGTGAWGLEALSRGVRRAVFFDRSPESLALLKRNVALCRMEQRACMEWMDATQPAEAPKPVDIVFLDPPYGKNLLEPAMTALARTGWIDPHTLVVAEHEKRRPLNPAAFWHVLDSRTHGRSTLTFLHIQPEITETTA